MLIAALGVTVYLNYYFSVQQPEVLEAGAETSSTSSETESSKNLGMPNMSTTPLRPPPRRSPLIPLRRRTTIFLRRVKPRDGPGRGAGYCEGRHERCQGDEASRQAALEKAAAIASAVERRTLSKAL